MSRARAGRTAAYFLVVASAACGGSGRSASAPSAASPLPAPAVTMGDLQGRTLLGDLPARAQRLGGGTPALVASSEALDNGWVGGFVDVPREECLLGYARGSASIDDVDVAIYSEDGTTLAVDEGRDVHPTVLMCPPHPDRVYVTAHVVEGEGLVAVGAQLVPKDRAIIVARALGARGVVGQGPRPADGWPGLEEAVRARREELGGQWQELRRVALAVDARVPTVLALPVEAGLCVDAIVVPDEDVALLDVEAFDDAGRSLGRAKDGPGARALVVCSTMQSTGTLALRPHIGRGLAAVVLARSTGAPDRASTPPADALWVGTSQPIARATAAHEAALAKDGYGAATTTASGSLALGRRVALPLDLGAAGASPGGCHRVDLMAGAPLALVEAWIWSDAGALLASGGSSSSLTLFACAHGSARLELQARGRPGPYSLATRPERWRGAALAAHPLAGARMLARAAGGPDAVFEGKEIGLREAALDAEHVVAWPETIGPGSCLHVTVGAEGEGAGVEVHVIDAEGAEVDRAEGAHAASARACAASDGARVVRIELRASAGRLDAVVGERTTPAM